MLYRIVMYIGAAAIAAALLVGCGPPKTAEQRQADVIAAVRGWCDALKLTFSAAECRLVSSSQWYSSRCDVRTAEAGVVPLLCSSSHCEIGSR